MLWIAEAVSIAVTVISELRKAISAKPKTVGRRELRVILRLYESILGLLEIVPHDIESLKTRKCPAGC